MLPNLLFINIAARWREWSLYLREASGEVYPVAQHKREQWAMPPAHKRDSLSRLLRFQSRLAAERRRVES